MIAVGAASGRGRRSGRAARRSPGCTMKLAAVFSLVAPVPAGEPDPADVELARAPTPDGAARAASSTCNVWLPIGTSVRDARPLRVDLADRVEDRPDRRLGGAAEADRPGRPAPAPDTGPAGRPGSSRPTACATRRAAERRRAAVRRVFGEHLHQRRDGVPQGDPLLDASARASGPGCAAPCARGCTTQPPAASRPKMS